ncbi:M23 family metallopeptidase [Alkalilimnicola sp. S0819]|uniref:M23 family metallopeptidase n=1 Tax=Alkalilimnicola sp. S0819 TaxID=2613922 RepID=UPI001261E50A|nr:M23 family metallopeptidase [Alkalilimnicola sp. S0819]KAB7627836.1 M23 family metallopeptidase [Alkalilimnicola sp. S0819]MPQ15468.1 peptidoglycan DD-metalloendopeptidase family protein [Alkalilimnicola sp. S0819]
MRRFARRLLFACCLLPLLTAQAGSLTLRGELSQGSLLRGQVPAGSQVLLDGESLRLSEDGHFVFGLGRDHGPEAVLELRYPNGERERRVLAVAPRAYQIQRIDGLPPRKVTPKESDLRRIRADGALVREARQRDDARTDFTAQFVWPAPGRISGVYGSQRILNGEPRRPHYGIDIAAPTGTPVVAPAAGIVTVAHPDMFFSGGTLLIDHGHGVSSAFLHLDKLHVAVGQRVEQGERIADVGATGRVTGPHLDWRINWFDRRLDPRLLVEGEPPAL